LLTPADQWNYANTELLEAAVHALQELRPELTHEPAAGPQDRVVQAFTALLDMNFIESGGY
jgi:hypothetical protein